MKILVVEDDQSIAQLLKLLFTSYAYAVDIANDGEVGWQMAEAYEYDLIVLDVQLPKLDGISLCRKLRAQHLQMPILLLTGQGTGHQKAIALNAGADDYVVKPFDAEELIARVQALLRRGSTVAQPLLTWGDLELDPATRMASYGTHLLALTPKEYTILELLLRQNQQVLSSKAILNHAWSSLESPGSEAVRVHIKELRKKLKQVGAPQDLIRTVFGVGYQLNRLYATPLPTAPEQLPQVPDNADLSAENASLRAALAELQQQHQELTIAHHTLEQQHQQLTQQLHTAPQQGLNHHHPILVERLHWLLSQVGTGEWDLVTGRMIWNDQLFRLLGYEPDQVEPCYQTWLDRIDPADIERFEQEIAACKGELKEIEFEYRVLYPEGRQHWLMCRMKPVLDASGQLQRCVWIVSETTEKKRLEAERKQVETILNTREEFLRSIYDHTEQAVFVIQVTAGDDFRYQAFNPVAEKFARLTEPQIQGKTPEQAFGEEMGAAFRQHYEECLQAGTSITYEEASVFTDRCLWTLTTLVPLRDQQGRIYRIIGTATDISHQKNTEAALRESECRYVTLMAAAPVAILRFDTSSQCTYVSAQWSEFTGRPVESALGMGWLQTLHPEDRDRISQARKEHQQTSGLGQASQNEARIQLPDGRIRWVYCQTVPEIDASGAFVGYVASLTDISDRKQAEISLRDSEARMQQLTSNVMVMIFQYVLHADGSDGFNYVSPRCRDIYEVEPEELLNDRERVWTLIHPDDLERISQAYLYSAQHLERFDSEFRLITPAGRLKWVHAVSQPEKQPNGDVVLDGFVLDISDRKQLELSLQTSEAKLNQILDSAFSSIVSFRLFTDRSWVCDYWSAGCERLFGYTASELMADPNLWPSQVLLKDYENLLMSLPEEFYAERDVNVEYRFRHKDGSIRWISSSYTSQQVTADSWLVTMVNHDISDLKQAEAALQVSEERRRLALELSITVYWDWNLQSGDIIWSDKMFAFLGLMPSGVVAPSYALWRHCVDPKDLERLEMAIARSLQNQTLYSEEYRVVHPDGSIHWLLSTGQGIYDSMGQAVRMVGTTIEISERKQLETERQRTAILLEQQIEREQLISDISQDIRQSLNLNVVISRSVERVRQVLNTDRVIIYRFDCKWGGQVISESVGADWTPILSTEISDPCFRESYIEPYRQGRFSAIADLYNEPVVPCYLELLQQFQVRASLVVPILGGETLWGLLIVHQCAAPRQWQSVEIDLLRQLATQIGIAIQQSELYEQTRQELVERQRMQSILQESEERFRSLSAAAPIGICQTNADGICLYVNERWQEMSGLSFEDSLGYGWLNAVHPEDRPALEAAWETCLQTDGDFWQELRLLTSKGDIRWIASRIKDMRSHTGEILGWVSTHEDITNLKLAENTLRQRLDREQLLVDISNRIRQTLNLSEVLNTAVSETRKFLQCDRVFIYRFQPDWSGTIDVESVSEGYSSAVGEEVKDHYLMNTQGGDYRQGHFQAVENIYAAGLSQCHLDMLAQFQIKANLVVPILQAEGLWGLIVANQCSAPRQWQSSEIALLQQLATQIGIAIQQSELYEQTRQELVERQRMQAILQESEERFRTLSAAAPIGICQTNADGICLYVNERWQEMSGLSFEDSLGYGWLNAVHPEDRPALEADWEAYMQTDGDDFLHELRLLTPQGEIRWISTRVARIKSATGEVLGYVGADQDITERKEAELKIREQALLLDIATDAIAVRDLENRILYWNQGAERLYGWTAAEAIGENAKQLLYSIPPSLPEDTVLTTGEWQGEVQQVTKTGQEVIVASRWTLVRDQAGQPKFILVVNSDITQKKQLEAQFLRAQRLESIGTLAGGMAHDLNNLLTPILLTSQILQKKLSNSQHLELLKIQESNARRGADLVKQVLTFARGADVKRLPLSLPALLQEVVQICDRTFPKMISVSLEVTDDLQSVAGDATQLQQVLMNLCVNARDAMPTGGRLEVSAHNLEIDEAFARLNWEAEVGHYVLITVSDTGEGIAPEQLERIFDPFFTTKPVGKGTGLGLSVAQGIIGTHQGFIRVASQVDQGTKFNIFLPAIQGSQGPALPRQQLKAGDAELILLVDDDLRLQQITQLVLEENNYRVLTAITGQEAIACYVEHGTEISIVLMDMMMPEMDGLTAIRSLQAINPQVKIIAMSGLAGKYEQTVSALGITTVLAKPFTTAELLQSLHSQRSI